MSGRNIGQYTPPPSLPRAYAVIMMNNVLSQHVKRNSAADNVYQEDRTLKCTLLQRLFPGNSLFTRIFIAQVLPFKENADACICLDFRHQVYLAVLICLCFPPANNCAQRSAPLISEHCCRTVVSPCTVIPESRLCFVGQKTKPTETVF